MEGNFEWFLKPNTTISNFCENFSVEGKDKKFKYIFHPAYEDGSIALNLTMITDENELSQLIGIID